MKFEIININKNNKLYESKHKVFKPSKRKVIVSEDVKRRMRAYESKHKTKNEAIEHIDYAEKKRLLSLLDDLAFYLEKDNYALVDTTLNKMINVRKGLVEDVEVKVDSVNSTEKVPEAPKTPEDTGIATILNNLIIDEWEAINGYNSAIATLVDIGKTDGIDVLKDIVNEENVHVGQLQKVLETVAPNVTSIGEGEAEAEEQLEDKGGPDSE
jgi:hypothetical protein